MSAAHCLPETLQYRFLKISSLILVFVSRKPDSKLASDELLVLLGGSLFVITDVRVDVGIDCFVGDVRYCTFGPNISILPNQVKFRFFNLPATIPPVNTTLYFIAFLPPLDAEATGSEDFGHNFVITKGNEDVFLRLPAPVVVPFLSCTISPKGLGFASYPSFAGQSGGGIFGISENSIAFHGIHTEGLYMHHSDVLPQLATQRTAAVVKEPDTPKQRPDSATR